MEIRSHHLAGEIGEMRVMGEEEDLHRLGDFGENLEAGTRAIGMLSVLR